MKCKQANEFALSSPFLHSQIKKIIPINIIINDTWEKIYIFHFSASACYFQLTSFPIASRDEIWKHLELLEISNEVIGKHLDELDAHWLTFGNDCLKQWEIRSAKNPTQSSLLVVAGSGDSLCIPGISQLQKRLGMKFLQKWRGFLNIMPFNKICFESVKVKMNKDTSKPQ